MFNLNSALKENINKNLAMFEIFFVSKDILFDFFFTPEITTRK